MAVIAVDWPTLDATNRAVFTGLAGLGVAIVAQGFLALRGSRLRQPGWERRYMEQVFFTYISLWEGLAIVGGISLGWPGWLVAAVAVGVFGVGQASFRAFRWRVLQPVG